MNFQSSAVASWLSIALLLPIGNMGQQEWLATGSLQGRSCSGSARRGKAMGKSYRVPLSPKHTDPFI